MFKQCRLRSIGNIGWENFLSISGARHEALGARKRRS